MRIIFFLIFIFFSLIAYGSPFPRIKINMDGKSVINTKLVNFSGEIEKTTKSYDVYNIKVYSEECKKSFYKFLKSEGYYSSDIDFEILDDQNIIIFHISPGPRYSISEISLNYTQGSNSDISIPKISTILPIVGDIAHAQNVLDAEDKIREYIENNNCLLYLEISHEAIINHNENNIEIKFFINAGPKASIGQIQFMGLSRSNENYVKKLTGLKTGQCFRNSFIEQARHNLQKSSLFVSTTPTIPSSTDEYGFVPVTFNLTERKTRTIKSGIAYSTEIGTGLNIGWENRNFFGNGEKLELDIFGNRAEQKIELNYHKPFFREKKQDLITKFAFENKRSKSFISKEASIALLLKKNLTEKWKASIGLGASHSNVKAIGEYKNKLFTLASIPANISYDNRKNILDPKKGFILQIATAPYIAVREKNTNFLKSYISFSRYFSINTEMLKPVLAFHSSVGSIIGAKLSKIPQTERFFVGGSKSLRGYAREFGEYLEENKKPTGGRSFINTAIELRFTMKGSIGGALFLDSGLSQISTIPRFNKKLLHGYGFGLRYMSSFGPIRLDVAFPLKRRKNIDQPYQIYLGIGQSF